MSKVINKELESVKIGKDYVDRLRENKKVTGVPIATFIEMAIDKELAAAKKK